MANRFSQNFTLTDILTNKQLRGKMPYISYKEKETETGEVKQRTQVLTVRKQVFDNAIISAKPYYSPLVTTKSENTLILDGNLVGDHNQAVDAVYNSIKGIRAELTWTANTANLLRYAMKEAERNKRKFGIETKLYLRPQSMQEIKGMSRPQYQALLSDIIENIFCSDDFPETQKKFEVDKLIKNGYTYKQQVENWKQKVGAL
jgi:hypothetical protein